MVKLRDYQKVASSKLTRLCQIKKCAYLSGECRTGKTLVALSVVKNMALEKVLVITKKKAKMEKKEYSEDIIMLGRVVLLLIA